MTGLDSIYFNYVKVVLKELLHLRVVVVVGFSVILLAVEVFGLFFEPSFTTNTVIHADQQNIIAPLLRGQAEVTRVENHTRVVREVIYSPTMLNKIIEELNLLPKDASPVQYESYQNKLRRKLSVDGAGPGFIKISASSKDPSDAFKVVSKAAELFIQDASKSKRDESREAFLFIDKQVKNYKDQLQDAEDKLKQFKSDNQDGTSATVNTRIMQLRSDIEDLELGIEEANTRVVSLKQQIRSESKFANKQFRTDVFRQKLAEAQSKLSTLRLSYKETYPDIVTLKHQIEDLKQAIKDQDAKDFSSDGDINDSSGVNPIYQELRSDLAEAEVTVDTLNRRLDISKTRLAEEYERLKRIAAREAQLAELTRDYDVTMKIYESMLDRKEKARLSMTLDLEGQGVTYKIQEPAAFPLSPTGLRFFHFALIAPLLGVLIPLGLVGAYIYLDPRIRIVDELEPHIDVPILGVVPRVHTRLSQRLVKKDVLLLGLLVALTICAYLGIGVLRLQGSL